MKRISIILLIVSALLLGGSGSQAASAAPVRASLSQAATTGVRYRITDLGTLGGSFSGPLDVNARTEVTGVTVDASESALLGFRWSRRHMSRLPSLGGPQVAGAGINDAGHIDGWSQITALAPPSIFNQTSLFCNPPVVDGQPLLACHATLWRRHGSPIDLGTLGGLNSAAQNKGINNRDQV